MKQIFITLTALVIAFSGFAGNGDQPKLEGKKTIRTIIVEPEPVGDYEGLPCTTGQTATDGGCCISYDVYCPGQSIHVGTLCSWGCQLLNLLNSGRLPVVENPETIKQEWNPTIIEVTAPMSQTDLITRFNQIKANTQFTIATEQVNNLDGWVIIYKPGVYSVVNGELLLKYYEKL